MRKLCVVLFAFILCFVTRSASAQQTTGTISGRVVDAQGLPVPGAAITITGSQGVKTAVTDGDGRFTVPFLTPGRYAVRAALQGFTPIDRSNVQVQLGQTTDIPFALQVGAIDEAIQVALPATAIDTTSAAIGASLDSETLSRLPVGRRFSDTLYLAPGVSTGGNVGVANPSVEGSSGLENQYVIDGVNITNGGYGALGSYSIVFGSLGNGTPYDFMQEVQVKTAGYEAEFGQATGGVINVVTKSGTNAFKGSAFGYARPHTFEAEYTTVQSVEGTVNTVASRLNDAGATIGGPVLTNRLFFFWCDRSAVGTDDVRCAGGLSVAQPRSCRPRSARPELCREGHLAVVAIASFRRLVLRRSCERSDGPAARRIVVESDGFGVQLIGVRRPQSDRSV